MNKKIILAYSGDLDSTLCIPWLKENRDFDVITVCVDVGQSADFKAIQKRAIAAGACAFHLVDAKKEYVENFIWPVLKAGAIYENKYHLGTAAAGALIAKILVEYARKEKAETIAHGASQEGNYQKRFAVSINSLAPDIELVAPWLVWKIKSREEGIRYLARRKLPVPVTKKNSYSKNENIWHISTKGLELEDTNAEPIYKKILSITVMPEKAPNKPVYIEIDFENGIPVALNGKKTEAIALITALNKIGGSNGIGISDLTENRINDKKVRSIYEAPGAAILYYAHEKLEHLCLDRQTYSFKQILALRTAALIYGGSWYSALREALSAFTDSTQKNITGKVKLKLYKGAITAAGVASDNSLLKAEEKMAASKAKKSAKPAKKKK